MTPRGRGSTRTGQPSRLPAAQYDVSAVVEDGRDGLVMEFCGEDDRTRRLAVHRLPLPGWHRFLADALAVRVGPAGGRRTHASVTAVWEVTGRLMRFLQTLTAPPSDPSALTTAHLDAFRRRREASAGEWLAWRDIREVGALLRAGNGRAVVSADVLDYTAVKIRRFGSPRPGYSDHELRKLVTAARADVANIRDRIRATEHLVQRYRTQTHAPGLREREHAALLASLATTGEVPFLLAPNRLTLAQRRTLAGEVFLTMPDLVPLLVLLVAVTGRNVETIKELPSEHRILEDRAVEVRVLKRRRGRRRWFETATWEIGPPDRQLHTPGGLYLLVHELSSRSRDFTGSGSLWASWRNGHRAHVSGAAEHFDPFGASLDAHLDTAGWIAGHGLTADPPPAADHDDTDPTQAATAPLRLDFNRLKTSIEVRRTRELGGHLPSAVRTNTIPVLFGNYLRGDPTVVEWAQEVIGEALADAEQSALAAHHHALQAAGGALQIIPGPVDTDRLEQAGLPVQTAQQTASGELDTAWSACADHDQHPATGRPCRASFLDCFQCGNCLITRDHLPRLLGLLDALDARRHDLGESDWWARYGMAWAAIRHDILAKFSPAEIEHARSNKPTDALLDLVETPWGQHP